RNVRQWIQLCNFPRERIQQVVVRRQIQPVERHRAARHTANRIRDIDLLSRIAADAASAETRGTILREIADTLLSGWDDSCDRNTLPYLQRFKIAEEKGP